MQRRTKTLITLAVTFLLLGMVYAYSVILAPLKSQFGWTVQQMTTLFALSIVAIIGGGALGARLFEMQGFRRTVATGALLALGGFALAATVGAAHAYNTVVFAYSVLASGGIGLAYAILLPVAAAWYPDRVGFSQGFCLMGYGLGGFVLGPLVTALFEVLPWRIVLGGLGLLLGALLIFVAYGIRYPEAGEVASTQNTAAAAAPKERLVTSRIYWLMLFWLFLMGGSGLALTGLGADIPQALGANALAASVVLGMMNVGSGIGRCGGGILADRFGHARVMALASGLLMCGLAACIGAFTLQLLPLLAAGLMAVGLGWGIAVVLMTYVAQKAWGSDHLSAHITALNANSLLASPVGSMGAGALVAATGSMMPVFMVTLVGSVIAMTLVAPIDAAIVQKTGERRMSGSRRWSFVTRR